MKKTSSPQLNSPRTRPSRVVKSFLTSPLSLRRVKEVAFIPTNTGKESKISNTDLLSKAAAVIKALSSIKEWLPSRSITSFTGNLKRVERVFSQLSRSCWLFSLSEELIFEFTCTMDWSFRMDSSREVICGSINMCVSYPVFSK